MLAAIRQWRAPVRLAGVVITYVLAIAAWWALSRAIGSPMSLSRILNDVVPGSVSGCLAALLMTRVQLRRITGVTNATDRRTVINAVRSGRPPDDPRLEEPTLRYSRWVLRRHQRLPKTGALTLLPLIALGVAAAALGSPVLGMAIVALFTSLYIAGLINRQRAIPRLTHLQHTLDRSQGQAEPHHP